MSADLDQLRADVAALKICKAERDAWKEKAGDLEATREREQSRADHLARELRREHDLREAAERNRDQWIELQRTAESRLVAAREALKMAALRPCLNEIGARSMGEKSCKGTYVPEAWCFSCVARSMLEPQG